MKTIKINTVVTSTEQVLHFLEFVEDIEDRFDGDIEVDIAIESKGVYTRW